MAPNNPPSPRDKLRALIDAGEARLLPSSFPQRELWENSPVPPADPANHICASIDIRGDFTRTICGAAVGAVVARQESLRTSFLSGGGRLARVVRRKGVTALRHRALEPGETLEEAMACAFAEPFDMVRGPLYRVEMLRMAADHHVLALTFHHAIADGWSLGVFVVDFTTAGVLAYKKAGGNLGDARGIRDALLPVPVSYSAWVDEERARWTAGVIGSHAAYWKRRLVGAELLFGGGSPGGPLPPLVRRVTRVPGPLAAGARETARREGTTLFTTLLTAFQRAVFHWKGAADVVFGVPHANRNTAGIRDTLGYFAGVIPIRLRLDPASPFTTSLADNHACVVEDFAHAMPFAELAAALPPPAVPARHRIFDVRFALQNHPVPDIELPGVPTRLRTLATGTSRFDIACELTEDGGALESVWLCRPPFVTGEDCEDLEKAFHAVLDGISQNPARA
jgi:hypothetical protein